MTVEPGNVYRARGGRPTKFWLVLAVNNGSCPMIGLDEDMKITTAQTYSTRHLGEREILFQVDLRQIEFVP